jgi:hypothetical protein
VVLELDRLELDAVALELERQRWSLEQGFFAEQRAKSQARRNK